MILLKTNVIDMCDMSFVTMSFMHIHTQTLLKTNVIPMCAELKTNVIP